MGRLCFSEEGQIDVERKKVKIVVKDLLSADNQRRRSVIMLVRNPAGSLSLDPLNSIIVLCVMRVPRGAGIFQASSDRCNVSQTLQFLWSTARFLLMKPSF